MMDAGVLSTISALAGTVVGAISSLSTTWMTTKSRERAERLAAERAKREDLYGRYMDQLAQLYAGALVKTGVETTRLTEAYALKGRIALHAADDVVDQAENALKFIVDLALGPARSDEEMRRLMDEKQADVIGAFAMACRKELAGIR